MERKKENKKVKKLNITLFFILFVFSYILIFFIGKIILIPMLNMLNINKNETDYNNIDDNNIIYENNINNINNNAYNNNIVSDNNNEILENSEPLNIKVFENGKEWTQLANLNIFANSYFNYKNIIAPGIKNTYNFEIENTSKKNIIYFIKFKETNPKNINLKYRLKKDNEYIIGSDSEWIYIDNVTTKNYILESKNLQGYSLEWYWEDTDRDTLIGQDKDATYNIDIEITSTILEE